MLFFFWGGGGSRGARVTDPNFSVPITDLIQGFPSVVFLNCGTNDLAANVPPLQAAVKVFEINHLPGTISKAHHGIWGFL